MYPGDGSGDHLTITATAGAAVPGQENGFLLQHPDGRLYVEPHGFLDSTLPLVGAPLQGQTVLPQLLERFQPRWVLASTTGGRTQDSGLLPTLLRSRGSIATATILLDNCAPRIRLLDPEPVCCYPLPAS